MKDVFDKAISLRTNTLNKNIKQLYIPVIYQSQSEWCWAACSAMVLRYFGNTTLQECDIVNWLLKTKKSCFKSFCAKYNKPCKRKDIKIILNEWDVKCHFREGRALPSTIVSEITADRPVLIGYQVPFTGSHLVLINGYRISLEKDIYLCITDPKYGIRWEKYEDIYSNTQMMRWIVTWTGIQKKFIRHPA